jgi:hypothetical protein
MALAPDPAEEQAGSAAQAGGSQQQQHHVAGACYWLAGGRVYTSPLLEQLPAAAAPALAPGPAQEAAEQASSGARKGKARSSSSSGSRARKQEAPEAVGGHAPDQPSAPLYTLQQEQAVQKVGASMLPAAACC